MRLAVVSVTNKGALLADRLAKNLGVTVDVVAKAGRNPLDEKQIYHSLSEWVTENFTHYDGLIFIMATGIVVRVIAPHIKDKRIDPAVVVMDDAGQYSISLLSGHIGGANELAETVARAAGATAIITTATDVAHKPAVDVLAVKLALIIEPFNQLKHMNAMIVNGDEVAFFMDMSLPLKAHYLEMADTMNIQVRDLTTLSQIDTYTAAVIISDQLLSIAKPHIYLRPRTLAVGIGCRRGTTSVEILQALQDACDKTGRSLQSIAIIGSSVVKQDEAGLLAVGKQLAVPMEFFTNEQIKPCIDEYNLEVSKFVEEQIGVGNVCETTALLAGKTDKLIFPKTKYKNVTVAIAEVK